MKKRKEHGNYNLEFRVEGMEENMETVIWRLGLEKPLEIVMLLHGIPT